VALENGAVGDANRHEKRVSGGEEVKHGNSLKTGKREEDETQKVS